MKDKKAIIEKLKKTFSTDIIKYGDESPLVIFIDKALDDYAGYVIGEDEVGFMSTEVIGVNFEGKPLYNQNEYFEIWGRNQLRKEQRERARK